jgi:tetratricopeptide (TPR) repeat protein
VFFVLASIIGALVLILRFAPASPRASSLKLVRQGDMHADRAERTAAVTAYSEAARLQPSDPVPHLKLARVYLDWGRTGDAANALSRAEQLGAETSELVRLRLAVAEAQGDWLAVIEHSQRLLLLVESDPEETRAVRHALAHAYVESREWEAARAEYETLLQTDAVDSLALERLGIISFDDNAAAVEHLAKADTRVADRLLVVLLESRATDDPTYLSTLLGQVLVGEQEWALSTRCFEYAIARNSNYADAHAYLGYALDQMGHSDEALSHLRRAVALASDSVPANVFLGLHYERLGDVPAARTYYESAYDLDPENPGICVEIGQTWAVEGRYVAAEIWLKEAVSLQPDDPELWQVLVRFYLDHNVGVDGRSVDAAMELVELAPNDAYAHDLRAWAALQADDYDTAYASLNQAIALDSGLASAHYHMGLLLVARGDSERAYEAFVRALDLDITGTLTPLVDRAVAKLR